MSVYQIPLRHLCAKPSHVVPTLEWTAAVVASGEAEIRASQGSHSRGEDVASH